MRRLGFLRVTVAALTLLSFVLPAHAQCALCRDAVAASSAETREAFNYAIIGLALAPYGVAGVAAWALSPSLRALLRRRMIRRSGREAPETRA